MIVLKTWYERRRRQERAYILADCFGKYRNRTTNRIMGNLNIIVNNRILDGTFYKRGNDLICDSNTAYGLCFMDGVNEQSIEAAVKIARGVLSAI